MQDADLEMTRPFKKRKQHKEAQVYCVCNRPYQDGQYMIACDSCEEWYHPSCLGLTEQYCDHWLKIHQYWYCEKCQDGNLSKEFEEGENRALDSESKRYRRLLSSSHNNNVHNKKKKHSRPQKSGTAFSKKSIGPSTRRHSMDGDAPFVVDEKVITSSHKRRKKSSNSRKKTISGNVEQRSRDELRKLCKKIGLKVRGTKAELVQRLREYQCKEERISAASPRDRTHKKAAPNTSSKLKSSPKPPPGTLSDLARPIPRISPIKKNLAVSKSSGRNVHKRSGHNGITYPHGSRRNSINGPIKGSRKSASKGAVRAAAEENGLAVTGTANNLRTKRELKHSSRSVGLSFAKTKKDHPTPGTKREEIRNKKRALYNHTTDVPKGEKYTEPNGTEDRANNAVACPGEMSCATAPGPLPSNVYSQPANPLAAPPTVLSGHSPLKNPEFSDNIQNQKNSEPNTDKQVAVMEITTDAQDIHSTESNKKESNLNSTHADTTAGANATSVDALPLQTGSPTSPSLASSLFNSDNLSPSKKRKRDAEEETEEQIHDLEKVVTAKPPEKKPAQAQELSDFLRALRLERLIGVFKENEISAEDLPLLTNNDLIEMGLKVGPKRRIIYAIESKKRGRRSAKRRRLSGSFSGRSSSSPRKHTSSSSRKTKVANCCEDEYIDV